MKHFLSIAAALVMLATTFGAPAEARGGHGCGRGGFGGGMHGGMGRGSFGGCIRSPGSFRRGPICGPYRPIYRPYRGYPAYGYGWGGTWDWNYLPCYDGGNPYMCDFKPTPPPPAPITIYQGGTVMREYGAAPGVGRAPIIINEYKSSPGAKPIIIGQ